MAVFARSLRGVWDAGIWALASVDVATYTPSERECAPAIPKAMSDALKTATVIVNGAGPVGLTMACELARHGIDLRIFDKNAGPSPQSRALAIFPRTLEVFSTIGMLDEVLAEGQRLVAVSLYNDVRRLARMDFEHIDSPYPFAISLPQSRTERILEARLAALGVRVERAMELTAMEQGADGVRAGYRRPDGTQETVEASWLLGCDGAHSAVRHLMGMAFQGAQYEEEFLLADVKVESDLTPDEAHLFLAKEGLLAYFPFVGGRGRIIADQRPGLKHEGDAPTIEEIKEIVRQRCFHRPDVSDLVWAAWFRISHRMVQRYGSGRVYLAGDAAHIHSPAGGQGMNTGIQDAFNLAWKLALVARGAVGRKLLESYEAERMPVARSVVNLTDRMTRAATAQHPAAQHLRDWLVPVLTGIPFVKETMAERMAEVSIDYRGSAWVENHGLGPVHAGDRAPDAVLYDRAARAERRVFDLLKTPGFVLLVFEGYEGPPAGASIPRGLPGSVYRVTRPGQESEPGTLEDRDCRARTVYGAGEDGLLVLIRPDGYVGYKGGNAAALAGYLDRLKGAA
jgi:2-polyprenyl-6-methoxyphenol hydroxylase-like FAD-dependent oxidoreductase